MVVTVRDELDQREPADEHDERPEDPPVRLPSLAQTHAHLPVVSGTKHGGEATREGRAEGPRTAREPAGAGSLHPSRRGGSTARKPHRCVSPNAA